ncbi:hypothetical protein PtA15_14A416 [Puccinia triticina]|uniref:Uncharacterized protein n=1 Tax=Puccinia triticina TaxID=208348 RepID=A0ABY7D5H8_9BASI|nr:uncharacterized protein PtA15_14A416 [Puccinia triticina]WAQ91532.1 hypothetical protein PtA15_14A416 [Puccinia triticina]
MPPSARPAPLAAEDDERAHLLAGPAGLLERKPTAVELRLAVLAFGWLCVAAIGFGLFAGELARSHPAHPSPPSTILTTTVFVAPTGLPSPPKKPSQICASGPCVDAAGELRRTTQLSVDPCQDFAQFSTAAGRAPASEEISANIDARIEHVLSGPASADGTLQKIQAFRRLCERSGRRPAYSEYAGLLGKLTGLWQRKRGGWTEADRLGGVLAFLHAAGLPALFEMGAVGPALRPQTIGIDGLPEAFHALFPAGQVSQRIQAATKLADTLARLAALPGETQVLELDQAQRLACPATAPWPCWIRWKDFFAALHPDKPIRRLTLHGVDYFAHMARTIAEQSEIGLESHDCRQETKLVFGPSLLTLLFLNTSEQRTALQAHQRATRFVLAAMRDRAPRENWPRTLEGPPTDTDQSQELAAVSPDSWVETVYALERIRTRRAFAEGTLRWDVLASRPAIAGDVLYLPLGALQMPQSFPFSTDLPKSLLFGSTGYVLLDARDQAIGAHPAGERSGCEARLATAFAGWAAWAAAHPRQSRGRLVGLPAHIGAPDALFFVAFGRLGIGCPAIRRLPPFVAAFNCSTPTSL